MDVDEWDLDLYAQIMEDVGSAGLFLNDSPRFTEPSSLLETGRPTRADKSAILSDAINVLSQLKDEAKELKGTNMKLEEEMKSLKEEKHELREEKSVMKAEKERMEERVKSMSMVPAGFVPSHPTAYHPGDNKIMSFPNNGAFPMWHWIPPVARDIYKDHEHRPPVA